MQGESKATAYGVVVDNSSGVPVAVERFAITNDEADLPTRLYDMAENVRTRVDSLAPDAVALRRAGFPPAGSRQEAPKVRLLAEGALVSAARSKCRDTFLATGKDMAAWRGVDQAALDADAKALVKAAGWPLKFADAASAALGALAHP